MVNTSLCAPFAMRLPFSASSVSVARQQLKGWLSDVGAEQDAIEDARVVISELVGNSVRHAQPLADGSILVAWDGAEDGIHVAVTDGGSGTRPRNVHASSSALAGRGMNIVELLSLRWWSERDGSRSTVHALLRS